MAESLSIPQASSIPVESSNLAAANSLSELAHSVKEKGLWIFGESESKRRVIIIEKKDGSYGFTLQSYGVRYKHGNRETDFITYVNAVEKDGAAFHAGLREGDVILSINGQNMARVEHRSLVHFIRKCPTHLKMLVISDERARKVELHMRYVHLQKKLQDKMTELEQLNKAEKEILLGTFEGGQGGVELLSGSCLGGVTSSCCFCPSKSKSKNVLLDFKEKSKTMGSAASKSKELYYDCYRKSQSTKELSTGESGVGSVIGIHPKKTQSGGELSSSTSTQPYHPLTPLPTTAITSKNTIAHHSYSLSQKSAAAAGPSVLPGESSSSSKPKSWDNLMTTKSFGGYGFGFGYGYYPKGGASHYHFSHPHHHNHHTHCSNHAHSSYYYRGPDSSKSKASGSRRSSADSSTAGHHAAAGGESSRPFTNHTTYKMVGTTRVVARVTMGNTETPAGPCTRTLPSVRSSSSSRYNSDTASYNSKLERTLSDSSINSDLHKEFPKSISYFSRSSANEGEFSSEDDYDEYATEPTLGPKNDIFV